MSRRGGAAAGGADGGAESGTPTSAIFQPLAVGGGTARPQLSTLLAGPLRKGKWTQEEEAFANKIILTFNQGLMVVAPGTTLRSYLSERLNWYVFVVIY